MTRRRYLRYIYTSISFISNSCYVPIDLFDYISTNKNMCNYFNLQALGPESYERDAIEEVREMVAEFLLFEL